MQNPLWSFIRLATFLWSFAVAFPAMFYDFPLTESSIRDAYFLGARQGGISPDILMRYSRGIAELHEGNCVSKVRIETPFLPIAQYAGSAPNYSAQDAVKEFSDRKMNVRLFLDICYMREAPPPESVKLRFIQNKRVIVPTTDVRSPFAERLNETSFLLPNGESAAVEFDPGKLDASTLTILIDTPNDQHAEASFDLASLR